MVDRQVSLKTLKTSNRLAEEGKTPMYVAIDGNSQESLQLLIP